MGMHAHRTQDEECIKLGHLDILETFAGCSASGL